MFGMLSQGEFEVILRSCSTVISCIDTCLTGSSCVYVIFCY